MLEPIEIVDVETQPSVVIRLTIPREEISSVMEPAIQEVLGQISQQDVEIVGPLYAYHVTTSDTHFDFEVGFPVATQIQPKGRVRPSRTPFGPAAKTTYVGPYDGLFDAWRSFGDELVQRAYNIRSGSLWEVYSLGPETSTDSSAWRTDLFQPLAR